MIDRAVHHGRKTFWASKRNVIQSGPVFVMEFIKQDGRIVKSLDGKKV